MKKLILILIASFLFYFNYQIAKFVYPDFNKHANEWYDLRANIWSGIIFLVLVIIQLKADDKYNKWIGFFTYVFIGLSCADVIDRLFQIYEFSWVSDTAAILIMIFLGFRKHFPKTYSKIYARKI